MIRVLTTEPAAHRHVGPIAYASRAIGRCRARLLRRILSPGVAAWDRSITVIRSFRTCIHPVPARRFEKPAHEPTRSPARRG